MNPALFFDTETTGLPLFKEPSEDPRQPHIVQLGACLVDLDTWKTLATPILKIPPTDRMKAAGFMKFKTANLGEAYRFFTGRELVGAHSALVDVHACMEVYRAIKLRSTEPALAA